MEDSITIRRHLRQDYLANDIIATLTLRKADPQKNVMSLSPEYHFHYTRFCLNTHFIRHLSSTAIHDHQVQALRRCVDSAVSLLSLCQYLGPARRDQLRYFPDFLFVSILFCSSFILQAVRNFPRIFQNHVLEFDTVKRCALLMTGLGLDQSHGTFANGRSIVRQLDATIDMLNQLRAENEKSAQQRQAEPAAPTNGVVNGGVPEEQLWRSHETLKGVNWGEFEQLLSNTIFELPKFFEVPTQEGGFSFG